MRLLPLITGFLGMGGLPEETDLQMNVDGGCKNCYKVLGRGGCDIRVFHNVNLEAGLV